MAYCIPNSPSLQGWKTSTNGLFGWNIGKKNVNDKPQTKYYDIDLTFSTSLVDKTFLRGTTTIPFSICLITEQHRESYYYFYILLQ